MAEKGRVFTGARARLIVNGKKIGYATGISWEETEQVEDVDVLDNVETEEHVTVKYKVSGSMKMVRIVGESVRSQGLWPLLGANKDEHLLNILASGGLTIQIDDSKTGKTVSMFERSKFTSRSGSVDAGGVAYKDLRFVAIRMADESEV